MDATCQKLSKLNTSLALMYKVLKKEKAERKPDEMAQMAKIVKEMPYFKERGMDDVSFLEVFKVMKLITVPQGKNVVEYGDIGENFYFILHGKVQIFIPDMNKKPAFKESNNLVQERKEDMAAVNRTFEHLEQAKRNLEKRQEDDKS